MDPLTLSATPKAWLLNSVLGPHAGSFVARLKHAHNYVEADLAMKNRALARLQEPKTKMRRYRASDSLLEFLKGL
jgi:hypothetical protein